MPSVTVRAYAKLNLDLRVGGCRSDGYHELRTIFQTIDLFDTLTFVVHRGPFEIRCDDPTVPTDERNLIWRAAAALWGVAGRAGTVAGVSVRLAKRIPAAAGLGGGSSNAASTLAALGWLWRVRHAGERAREVAPALGADVPFFLYGGTALGLGRGDEIYPLADFPPHHAVIADPRIAISTADAYRWFDETGTVPVTAAGYAPPAWRAPAVGFNDLEAPVFAKHPLLAEIRAELESAGARLARMSGSGSVVFGLFETAGGAVRAARQVDRDRGRTLVRMTRLLGRAAFTRSSQARPTR
jgi:4-diphosphocytidyl-2-C-methyl-D-erythritol kinase